MAVAIEVHDCPRTNEVTAAGNQDCPHHSCEYRNQIVPSSVAWCTGRRSASNHKFIFHAHSLTRRLMHMSALLVVSGVQKKETTSYRRITQPSDPNSMKGAQSGPGSW